MELTIREKKMALLANMIVETVVEVHPDPAPTNMIYLAFQSGGFTYNDFETAMSLAVKGGEIKSGPMPHTLVKA